jgi:hypothetical protein
LHLKRLPIAPQPHWQYFAAYSRITRCPQLQGEIQW